MPSRFKYGVPVSDVPRHVVDNNPKDTTSIGRNGSGEIYIISSLSQAAVITVLDEYNTRLIAGDFDG